MFGRSNDLRAIQQLQMGELDELLESIKEGKKSILKAETVEELISIKKQVAQILANKAGDMSKLEYIQQVIGDIKTGVDQQANDMLEAKDKLISSQEPVETHKDITHSTNEVNELVEGMGKQINTSVTSMSQIETVLKLIDDAIIEINIAAQAMKQQVSTLVAAAQNVAGNITGISSIAEQTNLLALNASIEAARAGEAGKGFAVVAEEIRELSDGTKELLDNMTELLSKLQEASLKTDEQVETTTTGIQKVETKVKEVGGNVKDSKESTLALQDQIKKIGSCIMDIESEFSVGITTSNTQDLSFIDEATGKLKLMHEQLEEALTSTVDIIQSYNTTFNAVQKIKQSTILGQ